jgi:putative transposase
VGTSKQIHHYHKAKQASDAQIAKQIRDHIQRHRVENRRIGLKKLYHIMSDCPVGRDRFMVIATSLGLAIKRRKKYVKTTFSVYTVFENLIAGKIFDNTNQVWVTDITYLKANDQDAYIVFVMDMYSKVIIGYNASMTLAATENQKALAMALRCRKNQALNGLIHHSDRGSQYISGKYLMMLFDKKIKVSMCDSALDNAYAERVNGIIKDEYLDHCLFQNLDQLKKELKKAVQHYNTIRPHWALKLMTPMAFEKHLKNLTPCQRTKICVAQPHT